MSIIFYEFWKLKQTTLITDGKTRWIKLENIAEEVPKIAREVGLDTTKAIFPHLNDTKKLAKHDNWREYYTQEIADVVYNELRDDFEIFGYSRELWKN